MFEDVALAGALLVTGVLADAVVAGSGFVDWV
jgi:hypothetical protein